MKTRIFLILCAGIMGACGSCSSDDKGEGQAAATVTLTLSKYHNEKGESVLPVWNYEARGGAFLEGGGRSEAYYAYPILAGSQKSMFLFTFNSSPGSRAALVGFYPSDAGISYENRVVTTTLPAVQTGTVTPCMIGRGTGILGSGFDISLEQLYCTMYIVVKKGSYSIAKATVKGNNGEKIAGKISVDTGDWSVSATESTITVDLPQPVDCSAEAQLIPLMIAPVMLSAGYTVTLTDTDDQEFSITTGEEVALKQGGTLYTEGAQSTFITELVFCGDNMVYMIDADLANETTYKGAVTWSWDATAAASTLGLAASRCSHLDDCKLVDNNRKMLVTSSYNWAVLLDVNTKEVLFHTTQCPNAHSAECLPNNRVAVACSDGSGANNSKVQIYDISKPNVVLGQYDLTSAHGVVWNSTTERLYAVGSNSLQVYKLRDWDTVSPSLELEKTVTAPQSSLHDLTLVNSNMLCLAGKRAYLYDIGANSFTEMTHFAASTSLKSVNYNDDTNEVWYTDSTNPEGDYSWSTRTIRYATDKNASSTARTIGVHDLNMYKVRVKSW